LDDIKQNLDVIDAIVMGLGANTTCFTDPKTALEATKLNPDFDVVIVDYMMPEINGLEWIQQANLAEKTVRIMVTSVDDLSTINKVRPHFDAVVHKPILQRDIEGLLNKSSAVFSSQPKPELQQEDAGIKGKVLVVEDNKVNFMILKHYLTKKGLAFEWADDGSKAIKLFEQHKFDLVLMDCMLPTVDGYQATKMIRNSQINNFDTIPIVALTADTTAENEDKCYQAGMNDYLTKPLDLDLLEEKLTYYLGEK